MAKINILDKKIYNRIAAGEVVERPYSVIKELIENAIDAGATDIDVTIEDGGKRLMRVSDNGCGISREDLPKAFLPHATSKISAVEDLDKILTLGFRGEALASIGSVSKATILSKTKDDEMGNIIVCEGGVIGDADVYPSDTGTTVSVENLFFNTPARAKFLKASKSEETDITNIITRLILSHPDIAFKYTSDGKVMLQSFGGGLDEAIIEIYGYNTITDCIPIETEKNGIKISGFIGRNYFTKPNRTYQTVILNGRYVVNNTIQSSMHNAYAAYLMKRQYPFYVLKIDMSPETVDVNVHPNKTDVRFIDNQVIYSTLYSVVTKVLDGSAAALEIVKPNNYVPIDEGSRPIIPQKPITPDEIGEAHCDRPFVSGFNEELLDQTIWGRYNKSKSAEKEGEFEKTFGVADSHDDEPRDLGSNKIDDIFAENKKYIAEMEAKKAAEEAEKARQEELKVEPEFKVIGQVLATYLILEKENDVYFIDQHAAHERLLYDKFIEEYKSGNVAEQTMLVPYIFRVNESESEFIIGKFPELRKAGFDISEYDVNEFAVYSVPVLLFDMDLKSFFDDLLSDISFKKETMPELIHDKIAMKACKAAIKSGKILSEDEIDALLKAMKYNTALRCPHGRPVTVKISRTEIDKWFKRIV
mgnify:FL=1